MQPYLQHQLTQLRIADMHRQGEQRRIAGTARHADRQLSAVPPTVPAPSFSICCGRCSPVMATACGPPQLPRRWPPIPAGDGRAEAWTS